ncbi:hypothetical protein VMT65_06290 [Nocardia sp. CDC153]|uniref:bestrophin-like domain n=1 Tax=Nocardia sp. CDC153 TaxID=3112167 RepID=UPI002DBAC279|nr:hypothetical protein [Nocardia sp. CDC153]MEC3952633.1 hypothetical protein [Nocardia sp. CDC153]
MARELLVACGAALIAVVIFLVGDRLRPKSWRRVSDESSGTLPLDLAKTFFTAVVAFVFVICWQQHQSAHDHTVTESKGLLDAYRATEVMPAAERQRVQALLRDYVGQVIDSEWPLMRDQGRLSDTADGTLRTLRDTVVSLRSPDSVVTDARSRALTGLDQVAHARHDRALDQDRDIPVFLYVAVCFGAVLVLLNPVLSGIVFTRRSAVMTALLGIVVGSALLALHEMERPYASVVGVSDDAFVYARSQCRDLPGTLGSSTE